MRGSYGEYVIVWSALAGVLVFIVAGLAWAARLVYVGNLDAQALADKAASPSASPRSASALDWPEILLRSVVAQPDEQPLVLLDVVWACLSVAGGDTAGGFGPGRHRFAIPAVPVVRRRGIGLSGQALWGGAGAPAAPEP